MATGLKRVGGGALAWPTLGAGDFMASKIVMAPPFMELADWLGRQMLNSHRNGGMLPIEKMF